MLAIKDKPKINLPGKNPFSKIIKEVKKPLYGIDYQKGDILFTQDNCLKAKAIYHGTRWDRKSGIKVAHVAMIVDAAHCIEAKAKGVVITELEKYFNNEDYKFFIRRPKKITDEMADKLVKIAESDLGKNYSNSLLFIAALRSTIIGHCIDKATNNKLFDNLSSFVSKKGELLCSGYGASWLKRLDDWISCNKGVLKRPSAGINPQHIFESDELFEPTVVKINRFNPDQIGLLKKFKSIGLAANDTIDFVLSHLSQGYTISDLYKTYQELKHLLA